MAWPRERALSLPQRLRLPAYGCCVASRRVALRRGLHGSAAAAAWRGDVRGAGVGVRVCVLCWRGAPVLRVCVCVCRHCSWIAHATMARGCGACLAAMLAEELIYVMVGDGVTTSTGWVLLRAWLSVRCAGARSFVRHGGVCVASVVKLVCVKLCVKPASRGREAEAFRFSTGVVRAFRCRGARGGARVVSLRCGYVCLSCC